MPSKVSLTKIFCNHIDTLRDDATKKIRFREIGFFFVLPAVISALLVFLPGLVLGDGYVGILITSLSVFAALLFNLLLLLYDIIERKDEDRVSASKKEVLGQIYRNISFTILVAVLSIITLLVTHFCQRNRIVLEIISFLSYWFVGIFLLTLLMVLKRVHSLLIREFD